MWPFESQSRRERLRFIKTHNPAEHELASIVLISSPVFSAASVNSVLKAFLSDSPRHHAQADI